MTKQIAPRKSALTRTPEFFRTGSKDEIRACVLILEGLLKAQPKVKRAKKAKATEKEEQAVGVGA